ncbi:hypothetical protein AsAng_0040940 [Aureispira anguillae]|uniref:Uncharacterized protein n=1 Tax=Aureispira anguillae TaxID=2864201 RepID=A0A915YHZ7_9BACT|nr:hypothetical protein AsAng_0040940 [Aureispira anguillae]
MDYPFCCPVGAGKDRLIFYTIKIKNKIKDAYRFLFILFFLLRC